jgi:hypothetical protein
MLSSGQGTHISQIHSVPSPSIFPIDFDAICEFIDNVQSPQKIPHMKSPSRIVSIGPKDSSLQVV